MENYVQWESHPIEDCYHIYSDGTRTSVLFENPQDMVFARNLIAILAFKYQVRVYCDVIMDTHLHLVANGRREDIERFKNELKRLLTRYFKHTGRPYLLKEGIVIVADPLPTDLEVLRKIIYDFRNPMDAGFPYLPEEYPWGVGRVFFQKDTAVAARRVKDMSIDERRALFHTREKIPETWEVDENGMILPRCYIDLETVHKLFGSPKRYLSFLFVRKKDITEQDAQCARAFLEMRGDRELRAEADEEALRLFGRPVRKLTQAERIQVAALLWQNRRTLSRRQLARSVRMSPALIEAVFH